VMSKYVLIASAKLRKNNQFSSAVTVFINTKIHSKDFFKSELTANLKMPTSDSIILLNKSLELTKKVFKPYKKLIKAGVILHKLQSNKYKQNYLFNKKYNKEEAQRERLNNLIDDINKRNGRDILGLGSSVIQRDWNPRREKLSSIKTTNIKNIPTVFAN